MTDKMDIWNRLAKTDPAQTKAFTRGGGFSGTAVKPIYCDERMTQQFGPCGQGWGINEPVFQLVAAGAETLVYCTASIWHGERTNIVYGVGGDKVVAVTKNGPRASDEAFKMAFTDAIGNAYKHLGMSADIHMGLFDDVKYVKELKKEFAEDAPSDKPNEPEAAHTTDALKIKKLIDEITDPDELLSFWESEDMMARRKAIHEAHEPTAKRLKEIYAKRLAVLSPKGN